MRSKGILGVVIVAVLVAVVVWTRRSAEPTPPVVEARPVPATPARPAATVPPPTDSAPGGEPPAPVVYPSQVGATTDEVVRLLRAATLPGESAHYLQELATRPDPAAAAAMIELARSSPDVQLRRLGIQELGSRKDEVAAAALEELAKRDADPNIRGDASLALARNGRRAGKDLARLYADEKDPLARRMHARAMASDGSEDAVKELVAEARTDRRELVLDALRTVENPAAAGTLVDAARTPSDEAVEAAVLEALGRTRDPRALRPLLDALASARPVAVRTAAASGLGALGSVEALPALDAVAGNAQDPASLHAQVAAKQIRFVAAQAR